MNPVLKVRDVCLSYHTLSGETPALSHISFDLMPGEFLSIVGPSGCGKSTLLNLIAGLLTPEHGSITLGGRPVSSGSTTVGYMLQKDHLLEWRSIYKNILLGLEIRKELTPEKLAHAEALLQTYGLDRFRDARPSQLSGGMRQRAALIRTLVLEPELLLLEDVYKRQVCISLHRKSCLHFSAENILYILFSAISEELLFPSSVFSCWKASVIHGAGSSMEEISFFLRCSQKFRGI